MKDSMGGLGGGMLESSSPTMDVGDELRETRLHSFQELTSQAHRLEAVLDRLQPFPFPLPEGRMVLFLGCGSSLLAARLVAPCWSRLGRMQAVSLPASEILLGWSGPMPDLAVAVSRTGETSETLWAASILRRQGLRRLLGVTCEGASPLAGVADHCLLLPEVREKGVVMTRAFLGIAAALLAPVLGVEALRGVPPLIERSLQENRSSLRALAREDFPSVIFLGSSACLPVAREAALKFLEWTGSSCQVWQSYEFRHGPKAMLAPRSLIFCLAGSWDWPWLVQLLEELKKRGCLLCLVGNRLPRAARVWADVALELGGDFRERELEALSLLHLGQLFAFFRALHLGRDPDRPPFLERVVTLKRIREEADSDL